METKLGMKAQEKVLQVITVKAPPAVYLFASLLCLLAIFVIFVWHYPLVFKTHRAAITLTAYNTAICLGFSGLGLFTLIYKKLWLTRIFAVFIAILSGLNLVELFSQHYFNVNFWFLKNSYAAGSVGLMSPTTAICLILMSLSLFLLSWPRNAFIIPIVFLNIAALTIALIAILGHGAGIVPAFVWLGIKMAIQTALAICLFSLATLILLGRVAVEAFNELNFFNRIVVGFGFMSTLVIAIGSIAFMQIHTVSAITHKLYESPTQINNASFRIKSEINLINRHLKNFAIQPELFKNQNISEELDRAEFNIHQDLAFIQKIDPKLAAEVDELSRGFILWKQYVLESCEILANNDVNTFSARTIHNGQEQLQAFESVLDRIGFQAQKQTTELNNSIQITENDAKKLVVVIVIGFLIIGATVASLITRSLTNQLQKIKDAMLALANENLTDTIPFLDHPKEIGDMARALNVFRENVSARRELETRLQQVIESMPNGIIMVNNLGMIEIVNAQAEKIFGYERNELIGNPIEKLIPQNIAKTHPSYRANFFQNPSPRVMGAGRELFGLHRNGSEIPIEIGLAPVDSKDGMKVLASVVDITERRNSTLALNESRERLELTTRINQIGVWEYIVDEGRLIWNNAMFEIYGLDRGSFNNTYVAWRQCVHPDDIKAVEKSFNESIAALTPFSSKFRIIQPDGTIKHVNVKAKVDRQAGNQQLRMLGTNIDVTREEMALARIHTLEALRSAIVEFSDDAIISKTPTGIITSWNLGAKNMFGYSAEEAIGKPITELLFPPHLAYEENMLLEKVNAGVEIKHFETLRKCKNGELINVSITLSPIKDPLGNIVGISAIKRDISAAIRAADMLSSRKFELEKINDELQKSNKELETFAYVASHDLKSPLRGIAQLSTWIEEDLASGETEAVRGHADLLRNRIKRMEKLLDDLLLFYRAGKTEGELTRVDMNFMVSEIFEIQNNKPGLRLRINNTLPTLDTFNTPLELVIRNFFSNAIKHHDHEEGLIQVSSRPIDDQFVEISVCDDGPGIPEKFHQRVFGMFQTLKPRDELEGSGMGLALIKKIVEGYGGKVILESEGRGTCFHFSWPLRIGKRQEND
ncbi:MAG: PAS domain S-box protein [Gammaproteobacteria bacterium]|nr:MAG: PAS domain S-box protein [Gammaproteobacteria bacterium]